MLAPYFENALETIKKCDIDLDIKNYLSQKSTKPTFLHHTPLHRLTINNFTFSTTYKPQNKNPLSSVDTITTLNQDQKLSISPLQPHHTPYSQPPTRNYKPVKEVPHPLISHIFALFITFTKPLLLTTYHRK